MKEAISMYLGGQVIDAGDCNYGTAKELGLKCPFCDSAVFLRSHSVRNIKGKDKIFGAYFSHYPCGNGETLECEKRALSKQGRAEIERIKIERRNQRLQFYSRHLWDMVADDIGFKNRHFAEVRKVYGNDWLEELSIKLRKDWAKNSDQLYLFADTALQDFRGTAPFDFLKDRNSELHQAILNEILGFLSTPTGGYVLLKIVKAALLSVYYVKPESIKIFKKASSDTVTFCWLPVIFILASIDWQKQFYKFLSPAQKEYLNLTLDIPESKKLKIFSQM